MVDRLTRAGSRLTRAGSQTAGELVRRPFVALVLRSLHRYLAIDGTQRGLVLAGQAFSALIPLLIVLATLLSSNGGARLANRITQRFRLTGNGADAVRTLFSQPPGAAQTVTIGSVVLLIISGLSCARTMQRSYEAAWQLPPRGLRGTMGGAGALALLLTQILLLSLLAGFLRQVPAGSALELGVRAVSSSALWLALQHLLLGGRVAWRRLLPGAVAAGVGQQGVAALSTLWIPHVIENNATRYGAIGVSFALLSWLVVISIVLVIAAAVSVELGHGPPLPAPAPGQRRGLFGTLARLLGADDGAADGADDGADDGAADGAADGTTGSRADSAARAGAAARDVIGRLVVLGLPSREEAEAVLEVCRDPRRPGPPDLQEAALAWRGADGTITVQQAYAGADDASTGGALRAVLRGLIARSEPGLRAAPATGGHGLDDLGIEETFVAEVAAVLAPGSAAVFAVVRAGTPEDVVAAVQPHRPTVVHTSLPAGEVEPVARPGHAPAIHPG